MLVEELAIGLSLFQLQTHALHIFSFLLIHILGQGGLFSQLINQSLQFTDLDILQSAVRALFVDLPNNLIKLASLLRDELRIGILISFFLFIDDFSHSVVDALNSLL